MLAAKRLAELRAQKQLLLAENAINRQILAIHWVRATEPARQLRAGYDGLARLQPYWPYLAPVAGFLLVRRRPKATLISIFLSAWRLGKRLLALWRFWESLPTKSAH